MARCFVIQPFDKGPFDRRYEQCCKPAIESAELEPYRVNRDPSVEVPIEAIEEGIRSSTICLADITTDNPNVWYELGYAFAAGKPVVMICSEERHRRGQPYPFDIRHRTIVSYGTDAPDDFEKLKSDVTEKLRALVNKTNRIEKIASSNPVAPTDGLEATEMILLATLAAALTAPTDAATTYSIRSDAEKAGLTRLGATLATQALFEMDLICEATITNFDGEEYSGYGVTAAGWAWLRHNKHLLKLQKTRVRDKPSLGDEDFPF